MAEFIRKRGVTKCPGSFTPEMEALHIARRDRFNSMTPEARYKAGLQKHRPRAKSKDKAEQHLEGDLPIELPVTRRGRLPQTPERAKRNAYAREYNRKKRLANP